MTYSNTEEHLITFFFDFMRDHPVLVAINLCFVFIIPLSEIVLPHYYGKLTTAIGNNSHIYKPFIRIIVLLITVQVLFLISNYHDAKLLPRLQAYMREKMLRKVLNKYESQHQEIQTGELITKVIRVPMTMTTWFERMKTFVIPYIVMFIIASFYFMYNDFQLGMAMLVMVSIFIGLFFWSPIKCAQTSIKRDKCFNHIHEQIDDVLRNLFSVYGAGQKEEELKDLDNKTSKYNLMFEDTIACALKIKAIMTPVIVCYLIFFVWRSYVLINQHQMPSSIFVSLFIILLYMLNGIFILNDEIKDLIFEWGIIQAANDLLLANTIPKKSIIDKQTQYPSGLGMKDILFTYPGSNKPILSNVSLHVNPGEKVCIVGDIGSGKSTLVKLFLKYHLPTSGYIYLNGKNYDDMTIEETRQLIGYVPQLPILFNRSIIENIQYGNNASHEDVAALLERFGLTNEFSRMDHGLYTIIGKNGSKLSGGQRQLVWCLRVFLMNPQIIILDEPTSSIDEKTKNIIRDMLNQIMQNKTVIMITHDPYLVKLATRVITMSGGNITNDISIKK